MAGKGNLSVSQTPQYGDKVALERLTSNTTTPDTGAPIPRQGAGRPSEGGQAPTPEGSIPGEHLGMMDDVVSAVKLVQYFQAVNAALDDDVTRMYLLDAQRHLQEKSNNIKTGTPDWNLNG